MASGYFNYFGAAAGDPAKGYYSYDIGSWHVVALNGECDNVGGCGAGSAQEQWLKADLATHGSTFTLAYWHEPRWSSGTQGNLQTYDAFLQDLYAARAEIVPNGHMHFYERLRSRTRRASRTQLVYEVDPESVNRLPSLGNELPVVARCGIRFHLGGRLAEVIAFLPVTP